MLATALVATGFSYDPGLRVRQTTALVEIIGRIRDIRRFGAAAVDLCHVACGRVDAYYERGLAPWDLAAGELIAREAGAVVTGFDGAAARAGRGGGRRARHPRRAAGAPRRRPRLTRPRRCQDGGPTSLAPHRRRANEHR